MAFDIAHTVLFAMECQAGIVSIYAKPPEEFVERMLIFQSGIEIRARRP